MKAVMKGNGLTNNSGTYSNNSQRKTVRTPEGILHLVYESMGKVWYERSSDDGTTWELVGALNNGRKAKNPSIDFILENPSQVGNGHIAVSIIYDGFIGSDKNWAVYIENYYSYNLADYGEPNFDEYITYGSSAIINYDNYLFADTHNSNPVIALGVQNKLMAIWLNNQGKLICGYGNFDIASSSIGWNTGYPKETLTTDGVTLVGEKFALVSTKDYDVNDLSSFYIAVESKSASTTQSTVRLSKLKSPSYIDDTSDVYFMEPKYINTNPSISIITDLSNNKKLPVVAILGKDETTDFLGYAKVIDWDGGKNIVSSTTLGSDIASIQTTVPSNGDNEAVVVWRESNNSTISSVKYQNGIFGSPAQLSESGNSFSLCSGGESIDDIYAYVLKTTSLPYEIKQTIIPAPSSQIPSIVSSSYTVSAGTYYVDYNVTVENGATLTIMPGANLIFDISTSLIVDGILNVEGASDNKVTFDFIAQSSSPWNQISVGSGGVANIDFAIIRNARNGVYSSGGATINITNTEIEDCTLGVYALDSEVDILDCNIHDVGRGIQYYNVVALGMYSSIENTYVTNSSYEGIYLRYNSALIKNNKISNCNYEGVRTHYNCSQYLFNNTIENSSSGVDCRDFTNVVLDKNLIDNNNYGLNVLYSGTIFATNGSNTISNNTNHAFAYDSDIYAQANYWGEVPPDYNKFEISTNSTVDYSNYLTSNSGEGSTLAKTDTKSDLEIAYEEMFEENYDEAEKIFKKLVKDSFGEKLSKQALVGLNECYRKSKKADFKDYLKKEVKDKVKDKKSDMQEMYLELLSHQYAKEGKYTKAISILTEVESNFRKNEGKTKHILFSIGELHLFNNDIEAAKASFEKVKKFELDKRDLFEIENLLATAEQGTFIGLKKAVGSNNDNLQNKEEGITPPKEFELLGNYPNPFNPSTTIKYALPYNSNVELTIYDITGKIVNVFIRDGQSAGYQNIVWNGNNQQGSKVSSGVYFYRFKALSLEGNGKVFEKTAKMLLLK